MADLHARSCALLRTELGALGFDLGAGVLERVLYPHYLTHPVGIGASRALARRPRS